MRVRFEVEDTVGKKWTQRPHKRTIGVGPRRGQTYWVNRDNLRTTPQIRRLRQRLAALEAKLQATQRINRQEAFQTKKKVALSIIPVLDDLERSILAAKDDIDPDILNGLVNVHRKGVKALEDIGVTRSKPSQGDPFDPRVHDAVAALPGTPKNTIKDVLNPAYNLDGRNIQAAKVVVST